MRFLRRWKGSSADCMISLGLILTASLSRFVQQTIHPPEHMWCIFAYLQCGITSDYSLHHFFLLSVSLFRAAGLKFMQWALGASQSWFITLLQPSTPSTSWDTSLTVTGFTSTPEVQSATSSSWKTEKVSSLISWSLIHWSSPKTISHFIKITETLNQCLSLCSHSVL